MPATYMADSGLARLVSEVRAAIGDDGRNGALIRTVHRFGYAFCGEAHGAAPAARALQEQAPPGWSIWNGREFPLIEDKNVLGRCAESVVPLGSASISRHHARIVVSRGEAVPEDLGSKNGTYVQNQKTDCARPLSDGDEIRIGSVLVVYRGPGFTASTQ